MKHCSDANCPHCNARIVTTYRDPDGGEVEIDLASPLSLDDAMEFKFTVSTVAETYMKRFIQSVCIEFSIPFVELSKALREAVKAVQALARFPGVHIPNAETLESPTPKWFEGWQSFRLFLDHRARRQRIEMLRRRSQSPRDAIRCVPTKARRTLPNARRDRRLPTAKTSDAYPPSRYYF